MASPCQPTPPQEALQDWQVALVVSCGVTAPLFWVLVCEKFCLCPPWLESLFPPVLWKSYNKIPLVLKARFPGDSQSLCHIPRLLSLTWCSKPSQQCKNFDLTILQSMGHLPSEYGIWFYHDFTPPTVSLWVLLCLWMWDILFFFFFFGGFWPPPVSGCSTASCSLGRLAGDECTFFYSTILNQSEWFLFTPG